MFFISLAGASVSFGGARDADAVHPASPISGAYPAMSAARVINSAASPEEAAVAMDPSDFLPGPKSRKASDGLPGDRSAPDLPGANIIRSLMPGEYESAMGKSGLWREGKAGSGAAEPGQSRNGQVPHAPYLLFMSRAVPDAARHQIYAGLCGRDDVVVLYRGLVPDAQGGLLAAFSELQHEVREHCSKGLSVIIDPSAFRRYGIGAAPYLLKIGNGGQAVAGAAGAWHPRVFRDGGEPGGQGYAAEQGNPDGQGNPGGHENSEGIQAVASARDTEAEGCEEACHVGKSASDGKPAGSGPYGRLYDVSEISLAEYLRQAALKLDHEELRRRASDAVRHMKLGLPLAAATAGRARRLDLSVRLESDIVDAGGGIIAGKGDVFDPLKMRRFDLKVLVFSLKNPDQRELAARFAGCSEKGGIRRLLLADALEGLEDWHLLEELSARIGAVYLLTPEVARRFQLERSPSLIWQEGDALYVKEAVGEDEICF